LGALDAERLVVCAKCARGVYELLHAG
jgi:hypothetical protein